MPTSYTSLLGLALPVTGELSGTWGDTVNDYITQYLDAAVAGAQTISGSQTAVTLSKTTASSLTQAGSGSTGSSQYQIINCTGNPAGLLTITVPAASKAYLVLNSTSTSQSVKVVGAGPTTGVTMVSGEKALIAWDGSDFVKVASSTADGVTTLSFGTTGLTPNSATAGAITVAGTLVAANGGTGQSSYTTGDLLYATGSTALSKLGIGTNGQILTSTGTAPQWSTLSGVAVTTFSAGTTGFTPSTATSGAVTLAGTLATTNGGTGLTSFTANGVVYASSTSALTTGSALVFDGNNLGLGVTPSAWASSFKVLQLANGTSLSNNGQTSYYQLGANNYFDGSAYRYIASNFAGFHRFSNLGAYEWHTAASGTAGDAISFTQAMTLDASGRLVIGDTTATQKLTVVNNSGTYGTIYQPIVQIGNTSSGGTTSANTGLGAIVWSTDGTTTPVASIEAIRENPGSGAASGLAFRTGSSGGGTERMRLDSSGNLGLGVQPSAWTNSFGVIQGLGGWSISHNGVNSNSADFLSNAYRSGGANTYLYVASANATRYQQLAGAHAWYTAPSGTAGNAISFTQAMTLDASGNLLIGGTTTPSGGKANNFVNLGGSGGFWTKSGGVGYFGTFDNYAMVFATNDTERARITAAGFTQPVAYADTVSALGNTGTATTINLLNANVFTATLTGNCTFTLSNPIATGSSSFTLILTNDGTAGRTVAWAGGSFVFPGGAAALSRTTTANAVDVWVFFTPNGGTTWYGNIAMKDMKA